MKRRLSQDIWVLIVLFIFLIGISVYTSSRRDKDSADSNMMPIRTTYSSGPGGLKALCETLGKTGYPVKRQLTPLTSSPADGLLFIISPNQPISRDEWAALQGWVERGNTLIVNQDDLYMWDSSEVNSFSKRAVPACPSFLSPDVKYLRVPKESDITDRSWSFQEDDIAPARGGG